MRKNRGKDKWPGGTNSRKIENERVYPKDRKNEKKKRRKEVRLVNEDTKNRKITIGIGYDRTDTSRKNPEFSFCLSNGFSSSRFFGGQAD